MGWHSCRVLEEAVLNSLALCQMKTKVIKTKKEHADAIERLSVLMDADPAPGSPKEDEMELLAVLIESYENDNFDQSLPDPIEAIKFRMDQQGLSTSDLIPIIGSKSKVSEIFNRKRPLSVSMMRRLSRELAISGDVLLRESKEICEPDIPINQYPLKEIYNRWFSQQFSNLTEFKNSADRVLAELFRKADGGPEAIPALLRQSEEKRNAYDIYALHAWKAKVLRLAEEQVDSLPNYIPAMLNEDFAKRLALLSSQNEGPKLAVEALRERGVAVVFERHLPRTYLDGAALHGPGGRPVIALTIRFNRLDNFWFCLFHELAHVCLHLKTKGDSLDVELDKDRDDPFEKQADEFAMGAFIPNAEWSGVRSRCTNLATIRQEARMRMIHPSVIAGRIRKETGNYRLFNPVMGHGKVKKIFGMPD